MANIIPFQNELRQELPVVIGNADYKFLKTKITRISEIIESSGIEKRIIEYAVQETTQEEEKAAVLNGKKYTGLSFKKQMSIQSQTRLAFRCVIARRLTQESYRPFSTHLAESPLLQQFCLIRGSGPYLAALPRY